MTTSTWAGYRNLRLHLDARLLARRADRGFDVIGEPKAEQFAALLGFTAARRKSLPVGDLHRPVHVLLVAAGIVEHADGVAVRHCVRAHQIAAPQLDAVDAEFLGGGVDQPLDGVGDFGPARTAIGVGRHRVSVDRDRAQAGRRNGVGARDESGALAQRRQRHAARPDIADIGRAHRQEAAAGIERQLDFGDEIAALIVGEKRLRACRGIFDRTLELFRGPKHQAELDEDAVAGAEIAADVVCEHVQLVGRYTEHGGKFALLPHRATRAGIERVAAARGIVGAKRRTRLHRHAGDAADVEFPLHHMRGLGESAIGRFGITEPGIDQNIAGHFVPDRRRAGPHRVFGVQHERQFVVSHLNRFRGVHRLRPGFGDHHSDGFADMPRFIGRQQQMRADEDRTAAGRGELHVEFGLRQRIVLNGPQPVGRAVGAGIDAKHARHCHRTRGVDGDDPGVRIRRTHHGRIGLAVETKIVGEAAPAGDEPPVFLARQWLADEAVAGSVRPCLVIHRSSLPALERFGSSFAAARQCDRPAPLPNTAPACRARSCCRRRGIAQSSGPFQSAFPVSRRRTPGNSRPAS